MRPQPTSKDFDNFVSSSVRVMCKSLGKVLPRRFLCVPVGADDVWIQFLYKSSRSRTSPINLTASSTE